jgi:N-acetyl-anhydromuramyl-L-alanine amidase AmpD
MTINKLLTTVNLTRANSTSRIKYIVIHYVGGTGGAKDNCRYFQNTYREASAHYFVGHSGEIWQCVEDKDIAWHCGADRYNHPICRNSNSIGIEMCCRQDASGKWYFEDETVAATIELTKELMKKYNIPASNVIRHYDVMGKICPAPYVYNNTKHIWSDFQKSIGSNAAAASKVSVELDMLQQGSNGAQVKTLQRLLVSLGYSVGAYGVDGDFGAATKNAVIQFQKARGLVADGIVGKDTWSALLR